MLNLVNGGARSPRQARPPLATKYSKCSQGGQRDSGVDHMRRAGGARLLRAVCVLSEQSRGLEGNL